MKPLSRSFRVNVRGGVFLLLALAVGYAAVHKGSNLLFMIFSVLAAIFVTSLALTLLMVRRVEVTRVLPDSVHANEPFAYAVRVRNTRRLLPLFCLKIEDHVIWDTRPAPVQPTPVHVPIAAPRERVRATAFATATQRGWAKFASVALTAEFPPGLFTYRVTLPADDQMLVYPREGALQRRVLNPYLSRVEFLDLVATATTRGSEDFAGVREYRPGDNPRWIHWRLSARVPGRTLLKEFEDTRVRDALILLETFVPNPADTRRASRLERAISFSAALAEALLAENYLVRFRAFVPDPAEIVLEPRKGAIAELKHALATLHASRTHAASELVKEADPSRDEVYFLLRIGDEPVALPVPPERVVEIHADDMRSMMYYAS
jgi:uncharacterized protein (DUF58 family)